MTTRSGLCPGCINVSSGITDPFSISFHLGIPFSKGRGTAFLQKIQLAEPALAQGTTFYKIRVLVFLLVANHPPLLKSLSVKH